jgi:hypothetical protein
LALAAVASALLFSGCSGTFVPPAAVVDGTRISQDTLHARVDQALASPETAAQVAQGGAVARGDLTRQALSSLIVQHIIDRYAEAHQITVTTTEINQELNADIQRVGRTAFDRELRRLGLALSDVRESIRAFLIQNKVRDAITKNLPPSAPPDEVNQFLSRWLTQQVSRADIQVNPRYGKFDAKAIAVCRIVSTAGDVAPDCGGRG